MKSKTKYIVERWKVYNPDIGEYQEPKLMESQTTYAVSEKQAINNIVHRCGWKPIDCHCWCDEVVAKAVNESEAK